METLQIREQTSGLPDREQMQHEFQASIVEMLSFEAVEKMRKEQNDELQRAGNEAISGLTFFESYTNGSELRSTAEQKMQKELDERLEADLETKLSKQDDPETFNTIFGILRGVSAQNMDGELWYNGKLNSQNTHDYHTSGRYALGQIQAKLFGDTPATVDNAPEPIVDTDNIGTAESELKVKIDELQAKIYANYGLLGKELDPNGLRNQYAKMRIEMRKRALTSGKDGGGSFKKQHDDLEHRYNEVIKNIFDLHVQKARLDGSDPEQVSQDFKVYTIREFGMLTAAEKNYLENDPSIKSKIVRRLAQRGKMLGITLGTGAAIGITAKLIAASTLIAATGGVAAGGMAGGLLAVKGVKGILMAPVKNKVDLIKQFDKRAGKDAAELNKQLLNINVHNNPDFGKDLANTLHGVLQNRIKSDRNHNKRHVAMGAFAGGLAASAGYELAEHLPGIDEVKEHLPWNHDIDVPKTSLPDIGRPHIDLDANTPKADLPNYNGAISPDHSVVPPVVEHNPVQGHPLHNKPEMYGVKEHYKVTNGEGYYQLTKDVADQMGAKHFDVQSAFDEFTKQHPHLSVLKDNHSYHAFDGPRISHPGMSHLNPAFIAWMHEEALEHGNLAA